MNKKEEEYLFKLFLENYSEMPVGTKEFKDRPDVIYTTTEGKTIGIEITESIYDEKSKSKNEFQIKFNHAVVAQLEDRLPFKFILDIELNNELKIKQNSRKSLINELVKFCIKEFSNVPPYIHIKFENLDIDLTEINLQIKNLILAAGYRNLPKEILNISLTRNDNINKSTHFKYALGTVPNFSEKDLEKILLKKNNTLKNYTSCNEQWLLIIEGWDFYSYFADIENINEVQTEFNKILMFRRFTNEVVLIK